MSKKHGAGELAALTARVAHLEKCIKAQQNFLDRCTVILESHHAALALGAAREQGQAAAAKLTMN